MHWLWDFCNSVNKIDKEKFEKAIDKLMKVIYNTPVDAAMAQLVERVLGKDEVRSSNLRSSSKKQVVLTCFFVCKK